MFWKIAIVKIWREFQGKNLFCISFLVNQISTTDIFWEFVQILKTPAASVRYNDMKYSYFCTAIFVSKEGMKALTRSCSERSSSFKFWKTHRKTPVPESLFFKTVAGWGCFPVNFAKFLRTPFLWNTCEWLLSAKLNSDVKVWKWRMKHFKANRGQHWHPAY